MEILKTAVVSSQSEFCAVDKNLNHFSTLIKKASATGAGLVCFPELALSCYTTHPNILEVAQKIPGPITEELEALAKKFNTFLSIGAPEKTRGKFYIAQIVVGPNGYLGKYRKHFPTEPEQACGFSPGTSFPTFMIDGFKMGINICADGRRQKSIEMMKKANVNFIHHPHGNYMGFGENAELWTRGKSVYFVPRAIHARSYILVNCSAGDVIEMGEKRVILAAR